MSKDARQKLRDMGGIMASSPDLIQAVQKFQMGGGVSAGPSPLRVIPDVRQPSMPDIGPRNPGYDPKLMRSGTIDPVLSGTRRVAPLSPDQARKSGILERAAGRSPTYGSGAQPFQSTPDMPFEPRVPVGPEAGLSERAIDRILADLKAGEISSLEQEDITIDDLLDISLARGIPVEELVAMMPKGVPGDAKQVMGEYLPVPTIGDQVVEGLAPRRNASPIGRNVESLEGPEATGLGGQIRSDDTTTVTEDDTTTVTEDDTAPAPDETLPPMIANDPEGTASEALSSLNKSYEEKLALFQKVFGGGDENKNEALDRAMSLAMIGLSIAAGQSPNALTNIAKGVMVGLNAMGEQRKERQAKKERVKVMALDAALKEHAAQQEFARELGLEAIKAGNKSQHRDTPQVRDLGGFGKVEVYLPTPEAAEQNISPILADPKGFDAIYKQSLEGRQEVFDEIDNAMNLIEEYDIAGFDGALARIKQDFGAAVPDVLKKSFGFDGGSGEPTPQQEYDTIMRALAARFTPIILGESGRTISNGDRMLVGDILGFAVDRTTGKIGQYVGTSLTSEAELKSALRQVRSIIGSNYSEMDRIYARTRPEQYSKLQENNQKQAPSNRLRFDINGNPVE